MLEVLSTFHLRRPNWVSAQLSESATSDALVIHCLLAHRGVDIVDQTGDEAQPVILDQVGNRMHLQRAILVTLMSG